MCFIKANISNLISARGRYITTHRRRAIPIQSAENGDLHSQTTVESNQLSRVYLPVRIGCSLQVFQFRPEVSTLFWSTLQASALRYTYCYIRDLMHLPHHRSLGWLSTCPLAGLSACSLAGLSAWSLAYCHPWHVCGVFRLASSFFFLWVFPFSFFVVYKVVLFSSVLLFVVLFTFFFLVGEVVVNYPYRYNASSSIYWLKDARWYKHISLLTRNKAMAAKLYGYATHFYIYRYWRRQTLGDPGMLVRELTHIILLWWIS